MLTDLEAVFRSLKSEPGLRPVYHHKEIRVDGHLFITVLACQFVQSILRQLQEHGIQGRWSGLRDILSGQRRVTAACQRAVGGALHMRKATRTEPELAAIYQALNLDTLPGGISPLAGTGTRSSISSSGVRLSGRLQSLFKTIAFIDLTLGPQLIFTP
ncbi:MAG: hypothetical protein PHD43_19085 [Methylococcales bacterium]|nr:hypothetical protein [Methylococcales bacterium]